MDKKIIIATLKMNPATKSDFLDLLAVYKESGSLQNIDFVVATPFIYLEEAIKNGFKVAAQNCFYEDLGPYTGEISALMLKNLGVKYVIVGHSERRAMGETDEMIGKKIKTVLRNGLIPILCIGETKEEKQGGKTKKILESQIKSALENWKSEIGNYQMVIAYEPVWSISTNTDGEIDTPENASKTLDLIKNILVDLKIKIEDWKFIYGGSVNQNNVQGFLKQNNIQGALVGGASLKKDEFANLLRIANSLNQ